MKYLPLFLLMLSAGCNRSYRNAAADDAARSGNESSPTFINEHRDYTIHADSIQVKNEARFFRFKYEGDQYFEEDAVKFTLRVTNQGNIPIPDIQTCRWQGKLHILINGHRAMEMSLANMMFGGDKTLARDSTDTFEIDQQITGQYAAKYGTPFTFQWEYMGLLSEIMEVNTADRTLRITAQHVKNDIPIY